MDTIDYYNKYASKIFEDTVDRDTEELREEFLSHLQPGDTILDLGCGSGRDSLAFYDLGYDVTPLDASEEMCKLAEIHTGLEVWGCGALIHEPEDELEGILDKLADGLCQKGVLFLSFLEGDFEGIRSGRYFCEYTEEQLERILRETGRFEIIRLWRTEEEGHDGGECWLNLLARKIS